MAKKYWDGFKKVILYSMVMTMLVASAGCGGKGTADQAAKSSSDAKELVVLSWGGALQDAQREAIFKPFEEKYGVKIIEASPPDYGKLKAMVENGKVEYDVMDVDTDFVPRGVKGNLLEKLDFGVIDKTDLDATYVNDYSVGAEIYTTAISYNTKAYSASNHPKTWAEFWDINKYPGARAIQKWPIPTLEIALLADGVDPKNLYPLDIERAFKSLDKIKNNTKVWWDTGAQSTQVLADNEVSLAGNWSGRTIAAKKQGMPVDFENNQSIMLGDSWIVPKGAKNQELAMKFIAYATSPEAQAAFGKIYPYGLVNKKAYDLLDDQTKAGLATSPAKRPYQVTIDVEWWADNFDAVNDRFQKWLIQ